MKFLIMQFFSQHHLISSFLCQDILLSPLHSNIVSLHSSSNARDQVSSPPPQNYAPNYNSLYLNIIGYNEMSSLARTLGSWVRIPLKAWVSVCVY
jgi:hypothetical protein